MTLYNKAISSLYTSNFKAMSKRLAGTDGDDLLQMTVEKFLKVEEYKILNLFNSKQLGRYFNIALRNEYYNKNSKFNKLFKRKYITIDETPTKDYTITPKQAAKVDALEWHDKELINQCITAGSYRKLEKQSKLTKNIIQYNMGKIKTKLKAKNILVITPNFGGVEYHRLYSPCKALESDKELNFKYTQSIDGVDVAELRQYDYVYFNRNISRTLDIGAVYQNLIDAEVKTICDIDDYWHLHKHHNAYHFYNKHNFSKCIEDNIKFSDYIFVTTPQMKREVSKIKDEDNIFIVPNAVDNTEAQFTEPRDKQKDITFLYQGGISHLKDIKLMTNSLRFTESKKIDATLLLAGYMEKEPIWKDIKKEFESVFKRVKTVKGVKPHEYAKVYAQADICLVPLVNNKFNNLKSELKVLEAAAYGLPVIVSGVRPYTNIVKHMDNAYVISKNRSWGAAIKNLMLYEELRDKLGSKLKEDVLKKYNFEAINKYRKELFLKL